MNLFPCTDTCGQLDAFILLWKFKFKYLSVRSWHFRSLTMPQKHNSSSCSLLTRNHCSVSGADLPLDGSRRKEQESLVAEHLQTSPGFLQGFCCDPESFSLPSGLRSYAQGWMLKKRKTLRFWLLYNWALLVNGNGRWLGFAYSCGIHTRHCYILMAFDVFKKTYLSK